MTLDHLPAKIEKITVCLDEDELGVLTHGSVHHYQPIQTRRHVSLTMTKSNLDGYASGALHPIFAQNLPEGFNRRFIAEKLARYARVNDMYLLALQGEHSIGMLSYRSELQLPEADSVSLTDILTYQGSTPLFPQLLEKYYLRNALAGVQPKVSIPKTDRTVEQKDLIVKSFDTEFPLLTVNEYVCMEAARYCGLEPPATYLSDNMETFIVERFDKPEGQLLGYEDFTTLLKKPNNPDAKYTGSYETLLKATHLYTNSLAEVEKMYRYIVFNCLIGNGDAHLKNFALQYTQDMKHIFVSPPFDITHTLIYDTIDNKMALKMANSKVFPDKHHLLKLAESTSFRIRQADKIIEKLAHDIKDYINRSDEIRLMEGLKASIDKSVSGAMVSSYSAKSYRHDKKRKFE
ncbi:type II toxin-antitoxin system HipA family toxin [Photobacterium sp. TLY01]|uniref:type II toxin-antitoxin system HipA family toxin n=1 Tax=Photobacterium sp. TLY01 TaxID=2907534 RepID=UPI001F2B5599|nr:type II toxin-antitoxin system HipA family toxin [Photobacterium sp. TLY01]UIP29978.1 type II toxin-antitoxin system HipA family toxin [Photobacterium sp. TLY01]